MVPECGIVPGTLSNDFKNLGRNEIMRGKTAGLTFLGICAVLAVLLLSGAITPVVSGALFAVALVVLGGISKGFKNK
jgi:hypothetical protein